VRQTQRPKYGYYLDHIVDAFSTTVIGLGIGLSPYVDVSIALGLVVAYLALSINVYLESTVFGVFRLAYGRIGPTEVRIILVLLNTAALVYEATTTTRSLSLTRAANWGMTVVLVGMIVVLVARFAHNIRRLAKLEPQRFAGGSNPCPFAPNAQPPGPQEGAARACKRHRPWPTSWIAGIPATLASYSQFASTMKRIVWPITWPPCTAPESALSTAPPGRWQTPLWPYRPLNWSPSWVIS